MAKRKLETPEPPPPPSPPDEQNCRLCAPPYKCFLHYQPFQDSLQPFPTARKGEIRYELQDRTSQVQEHVDSERASRHLAGTHSQGAQTATQNPAYPPPWLEPLLQEDGNMYDLEHFGPRPSATDVDPFPVRNFEEPPSQAAQAVTQDCSYPTPQNEVQGASPSHGSRSRPAGGRGAQRSWDEYEAALGLLQLSNSLPPNPARAEGPSSQPLRTLDTRHVTYSAAGSYGAFGHEQLRPARFQSRPGDLGLHTTQPGINIHASNYQTSPRFEGDIQPSILQTHQTRDQILSGGQQRVALPRTRRGPRDHRFGPPS